MLKMEERRCSPWAGRLWVLIPHEENNAMKKHITSTSIPTHALKTEALASQSSILNR
jgi:hypothetical protein